MENDRYDKDVKRPHSSSRVKNSKYSSSSSQDSSSSSSDSSEDYRRKSRKKCKSSERSRQKKKTKKKRYSSTSSYSSSSEDYKRKKPKKHSKKLYKKKNHKKHKKLKKKNKTIYEYAEVTAEPKIVGPIPSTSETSNIEKTVNILKPMTKEQWEKHQSTLRHVFDPTTGRNRLVRGDGEIVEEIVSKDRHRQINKQATSGDGLYYQLQSGLKK